MIWNSSMQLDTLWAEYYENEQLGALANSSFLSWQYIMWLENVIQNSNHSKYSSNSWPFFSCGYCESNYV